VVRERDRDVGEDQQEDEERLDRSAAEIVQAHRSGSSLGGDFVLDNPAVKQVNGAIGVLRETLIMRDHANGRAAGVQFLEQIHDRFAVARIEVTGRFVGEKDGRLAGDGARFFF